MISSAIVINRPEGNQRFIRENHIDVLGVPRRYEYYAPNNITQINLDANLENNAIRIEKNLSEFESKKITESSDAIIQGDYADIALVAIQYLRKAYNTIDSFEAYKRFDKFNDFRISQGWSINQVVSGLSWVGLTQDEWDLMYVRYSYLINPQRITIMQNYQTILEGDPIS